MPLLVLALLLAQLDETVEPSSWTTAQWTEWLEKTDRETKRLSPGDFRELPAGIRNDLVSRKCTVPQANDLPTPNNVVSGHFFVPDTRDWAILCSVDGISRIMIYRDAVVGGYYEMPDSTSPDKKWMQTGIGFSRAIGAAGAKAIAYYHRELGGAQPPPIDHEGLEVIYVGKASTIYYWHEGAWLELQGAD